MGQNSTRPNPNPSPDRDSRGRYTTRGPEARRERLDIRLTPSEARTIKRQADARGQTLTDYLLSAMIGSGEEGKNSR